MHRHRLSKFLAFARIAAHQALIHRGAIVGRFGFFAVLLLIFSRLWTVVYRGGGGDAVDMVWYLAITEWITLSLPMLYLDFEEDVRTGNLAYLLCRPVSYVGMRLAEGAGQLLVRFVILGLAGILFARTFAGAWPSHPSGLWLALPLGALSGAVSLIIQAVIGLSAFWLQDASPAYWVWQKSCFVLGGLLLPLSLYPDWLRRLAQATPFAALLYGPARAALAADTVAAWHTAAMLIVWGVVAWLGLALVFHRAVRIVEVNGG